MNVINHETAKKLLKEADILLFKAPRFPKLGWWVAAYTKSEYSHIGLVHFINGEPYCIEFKEFIGCRMHPLKEYINEECDRIDVFRIAKHICFEGDSCTYNFTQKTAEAITTEAKNFIGQKYNWWLIFWLILYYIPIVRIFLRVIGKDSENTKSFICSAFVAYLWRKHFVDLVAFLKDSFTKPSDIARSSLLVKMYTLTCGEENG